MKQHKLIYASSYDRGLQHLLYIWPDIRKAYPDATLDIAYGWDLFDIVARVNPERMEWKERMISLMSQEGIKEHGRLNKSDLKKLRQSCGVWVYPTDFTEINCITALEMQNDGCVPVTMAYAALRETVGCGVMVSGEIYDEDVLKKYLSELLALMGNEERWQSEVKKGKKFASDYDWTSISNKWIKEFNTKDESVKVSIITPTIRKGFWNIMANNIAKQSYKNIEWIIIDDYKEDRLHLAKKYAKQYKLDIKYVKGKKRSIKRTYGLVNANNTGLQESSGELIVILQDFVLMPLDGVEQLVIQYKKTPNCLIAPVDMYVAPKIKPDIESEDWFHGSLDVCGDFIRQNLRIQNKGLRYTENPYDFEQNYGAIPKKIAEDLGGWYEFYDEGLGYDNTDIAFRALKAGYKIILDETNICVCVDHWEALKGTRENVIGRARRLNDPRYIYATEMINQGKLPIKRTQEIDDKIELLYDIPETVKDEEMVSWIRANGPNIVNSWIKEKYGI